VTLALLILAIGTALCFFARASSVPSKAYASQTISRASMQE
jgi:hypothetical protein